MKGGDEDEEAKDSRDDEDRADGVVVAVVACRWVSVRTPNALTRLGNQWGLRQKRC